MKLITLTFMVTAIMLLVMTCSLCGGDEYDYEFSTFSKKNSDCFKLRLKFSNYEL